jgi:L-amino acid N-acyltransferase YncA
MIEHFTIRRASIDDLDAIRSIYNEGIEDRIATLETEPKSSREVVRWWTERDRRYMVLVASTSSGILGWASLNPFSARRSHWSVAGLSIYVARAHRGRGIGFALLERLTQEAVSAQFHKIVLHALDNNDHGKQLYRKAGFVEVGIFKEHGIINDRYVDVVAMERLLS